LYQYTVPFIFMVFEKFMLIPVDSLPDLRGQEVVVVPVPRPQAVEPGTQKQQPCAISFNNLKCETVKSRL
jgi:hypothetical protein